MNTSVKAILDANRNSLMLLDLKFSIGTLGIGTGTLLSAFFGMNLKNFIEESDFGFGGVTASCFALSIIVCMYGLTKLRKVQRVSMWGERGLANNRRNWRDVENSNLGGYPREGSPERKRMLKDVKGALAMGNFQEGTGFGTGPTQEAMQLARRLPGSKK